MLRAPHFRTFTKEKNHAEAYNNTTVNVHYPYKEHEQPKPEPEPYQEAPIVFKTREVHVEQNTKTEKILKMLLDAYKNNPLHINDYIVLDDVGLANLVQELTDADEVRLQLSSDISCCGRASRTHYVDGIVVKKGTHLSDFKIGYNEEYNFLNDYRVSCDFIIRTPEKEQTATPSA